MFPTEVAMLVAIRLLYKVAMFPTAVAIRLLYMVAMFPTEVHFVKLCKLLIGALALRLRVSLPTMSQTISNMAYLAIFSK